MLQLNHITNWIELKKIQKLVIITCKTTSSVDLSLKTQSRFKLDAFARFIRYLAHLDWRQFQIDRWCGDH